MHKYFEFRKDSIDYNKNKILFLDIDGNYYIFKDRYSSSKLNNMVNKIKVKKL